MDKYEQLVSQCHQAMALDINSPYSVDLLLLRQRLINEEVAELNAEFEALVAELQTKGQTSREARARMFKEIADVQYVLSGTVVALGIPMEKVFERVHQSNMSKLVNGKPLKRADGKVLKGPNYQKPILDDLAEEKFITK